MPTEEDLRERLHRFVATEAPLDPVQVLQTARRRRRGRRAAVAAAAAAVTTVVVLLGPSDVLPLRSAGLTPGPPAASVDPAPSVTLSPVSPTGTRKPWSPVQPTYGPGDPSQLPPPFEQRYQFGEEIDFDGVFRTDVFDVYGPPDPAVRATLFLVRAPADGRSDVRLEDDPSLHGDPVDLAGVAGVLYSTPTDEEGVRYLAWTHAGDDFTLVADRREFGGWEMGSSDEDLVRLARLAIERHPA